MNVSWNVNGGLDISSVRAGPSWVKNTASAPTRYIVSDKRRLTVLQVMAKFPKQPSDEETKKGVTFASASPRGGWSPKATSLNTPQLFRKPLTAPPPQWSLQVQVVITGDYALCSVGLDTRLFIDIKFNGKIVRALFDTGSSCTYLGKRALDKFPKVHLRSNLSTTTGIIYPNGLVIQKIT